MTNFIKKQPVLFLILTGIVAYVPFLGAVHLFDWDEVNFAESAREMLVTGNFFRVQIDFVPFWEKPPFFFWLQAFAMKLFGVSERQRQFLLLSKGEALRKNSLFKI